jgi:hypothetical protein
VPTLIANAYFMPRHLLPVEELDAVAPAPSGSAKRG